MNQDYLNRNERAIEEDCDQLVKSKINPCFVYEYRWTINVLDPEHDKPGLTTIQ